MNIEVSAILSEVQRSIHAQIGTGVDVYYTESKGALFVPEGSQLTPDNVILAIPEANLQIQAQLRRFSA